MQGWWKTVWSGIMWQYITSIDIYYVYTDGDTLHSENVILAMFNFLKINKNKIMFKWTNNEQKIYETLKIYDEAT